MASKRVRFTIEEISKLPSPPAGKVDYYFDDSRSAPRGFGLWVTTKGAKTFMLYRKVRGRPERIRLGPFPDMKIEQARKAAERLNGDIADGLNPNESRRRARGELTLKQLFQEYLERYARTQTKTADEIEASFGRYLSDWANRRLSSITRDDVQRWHAALGKNRSPYVANRALQLIRAVINWGVKKAKLVDRALLEDGENPAQEITLFRERKRERFIEANELPWFFASLADETNDVIRDFILLSLLTGARKTNVLQMHWGDLKLGEGTWHLQDTDTKNSEPLTIPLTPEAVTILEDRLAKRVKVKRGAREVDFEYVFPGRGTESHLVSPKKGWRRILDRAELYHLVKLIGDASGWDGDRMEAEKQRIRDAYSLPMREYRSMARKLNIDTGKLATQGLRLHDLRRSLGSWQLATGASLTVIGKTLGHKDANSTLIYARMNLDPVRSAMSKATSAMLTAGGLMPGAKVTPLRRKSAQAAAEEAPKQATKK